MILHAENKTILRWIKRGRLRFFSSLWKMGMMNSQKEMRSIVRHLVKPMFLGQYSQRKEVGLCKLWYAFFQTKIWLNHPISQSLLSQIPRLTGSLTTLLTGRILAVRTNLGQALQARYTLPKGVPCQFSPYVQNGCTKDRNVI